MLGPQAALALEAVAFGFAWWLGLYLIARNPARPALWLTGLGLACYAVALALQALAGAAPAWPGAQVMGGWARLLLFGPAICWTGALAHLLPEDSRARTQALRGWYLLLPLQALIVLLGLAAPAMADTLRISPLAVLFWSPAFVVLLLLPLLVAWALTLNARLGDRTRAPWPLLLVATLFFALSLAPQFLPSLVLPRPFDTLLLGLDLALLGAGIAWLDAFEEGETLLPDALRSLAGAALAALLFGGLVAAAMALATGDGLAMRALLLASVAAAVALRVLADPIDAALDRLAFARLPHLRRARADLRATAAALPRIDEAPSTATRDDAEFARLTRRALSHYGDLARLATSPLARLALIDARLAANGGRDDGLARAAELKRLLGESIARLKPDGPEPFGTSDQWRHYNALYYPYVAGLKPYGVRASTIPTDPTLRAALDWLRAEVPERTLHNWQTAAAKLVAADLRAQEQAVAEC